MGSDAPGDRVLVLAETAADELLSRQVIEANGMLAHVCRDVESLSREFAAGVGALVITEQSLVAHDGHLTDLLRQQEGWSDVPVLLLAAHGADASPSVQALEHLGNVTVLERPVRMSTLVSGLRAALKARQRQYELRDRLESLHEADQRKDHFLAMLAHELRNPLAPLRNALDLLRMTDADPTTTRAHAMMDRQVNQMIRLVDDLMEVSRITRGKIDLRREPVELADVISRAVETSRPLIDAARLQLTLDVPDEPLLLDADAIRLAQVFANLLNNSAKYTEEGGQIRVSTRRDGRNAVVSVSDTGVGITADLLPHVFDLFAQGEFALVRKQRGLGIGLTLAKQLVEMHGGWIRARSEGPCRGSEFVVSLPLAATAARVPRAPQAPAPRTPSHRVLVVDDNRDSTESLAMLLHQLGAEVRVAFDGLEALEALRDFKADLVVLDLGMPGMSGHDVARQIRAGEGGRDVRLVALSGWGQDDVRRRSAEAGFDLHLVKPIGVEVLRNLLTSMRGGQRSVRRTGT